MDRCFESEDQARAEAADAEAETVARITAQARAIADEMTAALGLPEGASVHWDETPLIGE